MKKALFSLIIAGVILFSVSVVFAQSLPPQAGPSSPEPKASAKILLIIDNITTWLLTMLIIVAVIAITIAAFYFITAAGDTEKVAKARNFLIFALIGVAVGLTARALVALIKYIVGEPVE